MILILMIYSIISRTERPSHNPRELPTSITNSKGPQPQQNKAILLVHFITGGQSWNFKKVKITVGLDGKKNNDIEKDFLRQ